MIIDNYKYLLRAICIQDNFISNKLICVYDMFNNEKLYTTFGTTKSCADYFNTSRENINCSICRKSLIKHRFLLKRIKIVNDVL